MNQDEIKVLFDNQASSYDSQWAKTSPIRDCLHLLLDSVFSDLPDDANILCVGVGTGAELIYLASKHPGWTFTALEPSGAMLNECCQNIDKHGYSSRCSFFEGYLQALPEERNYDAATCLLVSQFFLNQDERIDFFWSISNKLKAGGLLASTDLASDVNSSQYEALLHAWLNMMATAEVTPDMIDRMRNAYAKDVGVLPSDTVASIIKAGGFDVPVQFFQAGLICGWVSKAV